MTSSSVTKQKQIAFFHIIFLMLLCLFFLIMGNILFHTRLLPTNSSTNSLLDQHLSSGITNDSTASGFFLSVISCSGNDLLCVALIAFSAAFKAQKTFICGVLAYKSLLFGYCGAYMVSTVCQMIDFWRGSLMWFLFFLRYVAYFSILICFGIATATEPQKGGVTRIRYLLTVCCEMGLVLLINCAYYFFVDKI